LRSALEHPAKRSSESQCALPRPALLVLPPAPGLTLRSICALPRLTLAALGGDLFSPSPLTPACPTLLAGATSLVLWAPHSKALGCGPQCRRAPAGSWQAQGQAAPFGARSWLCGAAPPLVPPFPLPLAHTTKRAKPACPPPLPLVPVCKVLRPHLRLASLLRHSPACAPPSSTPPALRRKQMHAAAASRRMELTASLKVPAYLFAPGPPF